MPFNFSFSFFFSFFFRILSINTHTRVEEVMFFKETYSDVYSKWPNNNNNASEEEYVQLKLSYSSLFLYKKIVIFH